MRHSPTLTLRRLATVAALIVVATIGVHPSPAAANIFTDWAFILEYPTGNVNSVALMTLQGGQLAGNALIAGKRCAFKVSGTFTGDARTGGSFEMAWTGLGRCSAETLSFTGDVLNDEITGTFTDTSEVDTLDFTGTVLFGAHGQ